MRRLFAIIAAVSFLGGCAAMGAGADTRTMGMGQARVDTRLVDWVSTDAGYRVDPFRAIYGPGD